MPQVTNVSCDKKQTTGDASSRSGDDVARTSRALLTLGLWLPVPLLLHIHLLARLGLICCLSLGFRPQPRKNEAAAPCRSTAAERRVSTCDDDRISSDKRARRLGRCGESGAVNGSRDAEVAGQGWVWAAGSAMTWRSAANKICTSFTLPYGPLAVPKEGLRTRADFIMAVHR